MNVKVIIEHPRAREVLWKNNYLPTNTEIELDATDALHISKRQKTIFFLTREKYNPETWKKKIIGFTANADTTSGFGNCTTNMLLQLYDHGYDVRWLGTQFNADKVAKMALKEIPLDMAMVYHEQPKSSWITDPWEKRFAILPFETTRIPASWVNNVNQLTALIVLCSQNIQTMRDSGVTIPIEEMRWGVETNHFPYVERDNKVFTFGHMGALTVRKGTDLVIAAFQKAFPLRDKKYLTSVKMILKTSSPVFKFPINKDPRIVVQIGEYAKDELMTQFAKKCDVFVFPTRGEGAGLPPLEMMATGMPAIVTNWSGPADWITDELGYPLNKFKMVHADAFAKKDVYNEDCGDWAEPDLDELVEKMRYCYEHPQEVKDKGKVAAEYIRKNWTWEQGFDTFEKVMKKYLG